jgi:hypothetical protein
VSVNSHRPAGSLYSASWATIAIALCVAIGTWGFWIGGSLTAGTREVPPRTQSTSVPHIVTVNPDLGTVYGAKFCTEISPRPTSIVIESVSGQVLSTSPC